MHSEISFQRGDKKYEFNLVHNLEDNGLDIEAALWSWLARTNKFTQKSFCAYVVSKDPINIICLSKKEYDRILNENSLV